MGSRNDELPVPKRRKILLAPPNTSKYQRVLNMLSELSFANAVQPETKFQYEHYLQTFLEGLRPGHGLLGNEQEEKDLNDQIELQGTHFLFYFPSLTSQKSLLEPKLIVYKEQKEEEEIEEQEQEQNESEMLSDFGYQADFVEVNKQHIPIWEYLGYSWIKYIVCLFVSVSHLKYC